MFYVLIIKTITISAYDEIPKKCCAEQYPNYIYMGSSHALHLHHHVT